MSWLKRIFDLRPAKRLVPRDGMAVTVDTWQGAHDYHDNLFRTALLTTRGWGIIDGLDVSLDSDPLRIHIGDGVAIDPEGNLLAFKEDSIRIDNMLGKVYIVLQLDHPLSEPQLDRTLPEDPKDYYEAEIARIHLTLANAQNQQPSVEVARIDRTSANTPIKLASDPTNPGKDELDLRFRYLLGAKTPLYLATVKADDNVPNEHIVGWRRLAQEVSYTTSRPILLEELDGKTLPVPDKLHKYNMICLIGREQFNLDQIRCKYLEDYINAGGVLLYESCRQTGRPGPTPADKLFQDWINKLAASGPLQEIMETDPLKLDPYLFRKLPRGYDDPNPREFKLTRAVGKGVVLYNNVDYGCAFAGKLANLNQPARNDLRETFEWGHNLLALASRRKR